MCRIYLGSGRMSEKFKNFAIDLLELCNNLKMCFIPSNSVMNMKILKIGSVIKKILKYTALVETKLREFGKTSASPVTPDSAKVQFSIEEEISALRSKLTRNVNKFKTSLPSLGIDIGVREKELSTLIKNINDATTDLRK